MKDIVYTRSIKRHPFSLGNRLYDYDSGQEINSCIDGYQGIFNLNGVVKDTMRTWIDSNGVRNWGV